MTKKRIVVGISGASGIPLAVRVLGELNRAENVETHLVYTRGAELTAEYEGRSPVQLSDSMENWQWDSSKPKCTDRQSSVIHTSGSTGILQENSSETGCMDGRDRVPSQSSDSMAAVRALADVVYENDDLGASIASGTFETDGMIIVPCSMKTVAGIACGYTDNLLLRAADVMLKEQRKLVLAVRETPFSPIHLENMLKLSRIPGVSILPLMLTYYNNPATIEDMERHIVGKLLQRFGIEAEGFRRWK